MKAPITKAEALKQVESGVLGTFVEFRKSIAEIIKWRDKAGSGKMLQAPTLRHTVESETSTISVNERVEDTFDVLTYRPPFEKGAKCFLIVTEYRTERGNVSARGELIPLKG